MGVPVECLSAAFVQATIALEILVGEEEEKGRNGISLEEEKGRNGISLAALMKNRCAYLLADSHKERSKIIEDIAKIYRVRSSIVHAGKDRLKSNERFLLVLLKSYVGKIIRKECKLIWNSRSK